MASSTTTTTTGLLAACAAALAALAGGVTVGPGGDHATIREALADLGAGGGLVELLDGTHTGDGNCNVTTSGTGPLTVRGGGADVATVDCEDELPFLESTSNGPFRLEDLTVTRASRNGSGSALHATSTNTHLTRVHFLNNTAAGVDSLGGAVFSNSGSFTVTGCRFEFNHAGGDGGGVYISNAHARVENVTLASNTADRNGGNIFCVNASIEVFNASTSSSVTDGVGCDACSVTVVDADGEREEQTCESPAPATSAPAFAWLAAAAAAAWAAAR